MHRIGFVLRTAGVLPFLFASTLPAEVICGPEWLEDLPPIGGAVYSTTTWDPDAEGPQPPLLIVGGSFGEAGGAAASHIAAFDGQTWSPLGEGLNEIPLAFVEYEGDLVAGGRFTMAGGAPANYVARWDGTSWSPLGGGLNMFVYSLAVYNGELYAGGLFMLNGTRSIARWDGTEWAPVGSGMAFQDCAGCGTGVYALMPFDGELVAGGYFNQAGSAEAWYVASWNGTRWTNLSVGFDRQVEALAVYNGQLVAGGLFTKTRFNTPADRVALWNGQAWSAVGEGTSGPVFALTVNNQRLFAGGWFADAGGEPANHVAQWDGSSWSPLGSGMGSMVLTMTPYDGDMLAGGHFETAGGVDSIRWARWRDLPPPQIVASPQSRAVEVGQDAQFSVVAANGVGEFRYMWRRNGLPLVDGEWISGSDSASLTMTRVGMSDQGVYSVMVADDCGSTISAGAGLTVGCPGFVAADLDRDCDVDEDDLAIFQACAAGAGVPARPDCPKWPNHRTRAIADFDDDGDVDMDDFAILQRCYSGRNLPPPPDCAD